MEQDQDYAARIAALEDRMEQMEALMLARLGISAANMVGGNPQQERPEMVAIRNAWLAGDKIQAIKLYRHLYGVDLREAKSALEGMWGNRG